MFSGRKKPRGTPRGNVSRRTPHGSVGAGGSRSRFGISNATSSAVRRNNYSANFGYGKNSGGTSWVNEYVSPAKKARTDFFQSKPSTLSNSRREETSSQSVFKVLVSDFPHEVTQALDKTASVGGTEDGVYSWAIRSGQMYVWNNLTRKVVHNDVNLPSLPSGLQHPANLILSTRKNGARGANKLNSMPNARSSHENNYTLLVISPLGIIRFHENIDSVNYVQGRIDMFDDELVVDVEQVPLDNAYFYLCSTSRGRLFNILKPQNVVQIMTAPVTANVSTPTDSGGLISTVAGWIGWGGGSENGSNSQVQGGNDVLMSDARYNSLINGSNYVASSFVIRVNNDILHLSHTVDDKKSYVCLTHLNVAKDGESGAAIQSCNDVTNLIFERNIDSKVSAADGERIGMTENEDAYVEVPFSYSVIIQAACVPLHQRLFLLIARPIRKDEENITATSSTNVFVYELHEYEVLLNKKNHNSRKKQRNLPIKLIRTCSLFQYPTLEEEGVHCVASINSNAKGGPVIRTYIVSELGSLATNLLNVIEVSWIMGDDEKKPTTRTISTKAVLYQNFLGLLRGSDGPIFISKERDFGMFTSEGCFIFPNISLEQNVRSQSPVTSLSDAVAIAGMSDTYDLEGATRLLHASTDLLLQTNDIGALRKKLQQWLQTASSASVEADVVDIFGKAIVTTSTAIVDQKVGSGNQWADTSDGLENKFSAAGHKLVRQFLQEKLKRHRALSFLLSVDESSDHEPRDTNNNFNAKFLNIKETFGQQCSIVSTHALFLQAAISMLAYQEAIGSGTDKYWASPASEAIVQTVKNDRGWTREKLQGLGLVAADVFYSSPRDILQVLPHLLQATRSLAEDNNDKAILLSASNEAIAITHILISKLRPSTLHITSGKDVIFSVQTRHAVESLLLESIRVIKLAQDVQVSQRDNIATESDAIALKGIEDLKDMVMSCVECLLDVLNSMKRVTVGSGESSTTRGTSGAGARDIDIQFKRIIEDIVFPLLDDGGMMLKRSIKLADMYFHHELLARVCEKEEQIEGHDTGRLQKYMSNPRLKEEGFTDFIYARLLKQKKVARVLNQPEERSDDLKEYLAKHPKLSWVHAIRSRRYVAACDALQHTAEAPLHSGLEVKLDDRGKRGTLFGESFHTQKMLFSIAKLSLHAGTRPDDRSEINGEYNSKMRDLNANLLIVNAHMKILGVCEEIKSSGETIIDLESDSTVAKLVKGERLSPRNLAKLYIKVIQNLMKMSEDNASRVIDLSKTIIEYIWETELCKCEQLNTSIRDELLGNVWFEIVTFDLTLIRELSSLREKRGGLNDAGIEDEIKSKSLTYAIIYYISTMGMEARNLSVLLIENHLKAKKGVTIRDLRMVGSILDLGKKSAAGMEGGKA